MIQPIGMLNSATTMIKPVQFNSQKQNGLNNSVNNQPQYANMNSGELSPKMANATRGQKLDFYA